MKRRLKAIWERVNTNEVMTALVLVIMAANLLVLGLTLLKRAEAQRAVATPGSQQSTR